MKTLFKIAVIVLAIIGGAYVYKSHNEGKSADDMTKELNLGKAVETTKNIANGVFDVVKKELNECTSDDVEKLKDERKKYKKGSDEYKKITDKINEIEEYLRNK